MQRISRGGLERRWQAIREAMRERGFDFLIAQSSVGIFDATIQWFTDEPVDDGYTVTLVFPANDEMTVVTHSATDAQFSLANGPGVKKRIYSPMLPTLQTRMQHAEKVAQELMPFKGPRIGLVGMHLMSAAFFQYLTTQLSDAQFEDATDLFDRLKAIKSEEEVGLLRQTAKLQDELFAHILTRIGSGVDTTAIRAEIVRKALELGATKTNILIWVTPKGVAPYSISELDSLGLHTLAPGYQATILLETNGPSGLWTELGRIVTIGEPTDAVKDQFELAAELQKQAASMLVPGAMPSDIWNANNSVLRQRGCAEEARIFVHGMGYDMVERPAVDLVETMTIAEGMNLAVHPTAVNAGARAFVCDNYLVRSDGPAARLHETEQRIYAV